MAKLQYHSSPPPRFQIEDYKDTMFVHLQGRAAFSAFRLETLTQALHVRAPSVVSVQAEFVHLLELARPLQGDELMTLGRILGYGAGARIAQENPHLLLVTPRIGMVSPWQARS
jgi:phosphoribosylformylglycinamidine synthase